MKTMLRMKNLVILLAVGMGTSVVVGAIVWGGGRSGPGTAVSSTATSSILFGNPDGNFPVPPAGRVVNTSHPEQVIGNGTPSNCTSNAVVRAVAVGGIIQIQLREKADHDTDDDDCECCQD